MAITKKRILFFIADCTPTEEEAAAAAKLNTMMFRNIQMVQPEHSLEQCDGVAGCAPASYVAKFGRVDAPAEKKPAAPEKK
jgi:hypothetical protein